MKRRVVEAAHRNGIDIRRSVGWLTTAIGCFSLPFIAFGGMIAYADYAVAGSEEAGWLGLVPPVALALWFFLLFRVLRALLRCSGGR